jgi:DNA-binding transcriptional MocR family regulator
MPTTLQHVRQVYAGRARAMCEALQQHLGEGLSFHKPMGGLFVWAKLTGKTGFTTDGNLLAKRAIEKGVAFVPGAPFFAGALMTASGLWLAIRSMKKNAVA